MSRSSHSVTHKSRARSRLTNKSGLLPSVDGRSLWARRFRDLNGLFASDLGGDPTLLSEGQRQLVRRASALSLELEHMEDLFAQNGRAELAELEEFQRATNTLRRLCECLNIHHGRIARDVTPDLQTYLRDQYGVGSEEAEA